MVPSATNFLSSPVVLVQHIAFAVASPESTLLRATMILKLQSLTGFPVICLLDPTLRFLPLSARECLLYLSILRVFIQQSSDYGYVDFL
jgi:hypothetical protein